jgi:hypothetical protein
MKFQQEKYKSMDMGCEFLINFKDAVHMTSCRMLWAYELSDKIVIPY